MVGGSPNNKIGQICWYKAKKKMDHGVHFLTDLGSRRKEKQAPMLSYQSKQKETAYGGADMTAPEVSSRIQCWSREIFPALLPLLLSSTRLEDSSFSRALKPASVWDTWEDAEMVIRVTHGI